MKKEIRLNAFHSQHGAIHIFARLEASIREPTMKDFEVVSVGLSNDTSLVEEDLSETDRIFIRKILLDNWKN